MFQYWVLLVLLLFVLLLCQSIWLYFFYALSHSIFNCLRTVKFVPANRGYVILKFHVRREQVQRFFPILRLYLGQDIFTVFPWLLFSQSLLVFEELACRVKLFAHVLVFINLLLAILIAQPKLLESSCSGVIMDSCTIVLLQVVRCFWIFKRLLVVHIMRRKASCSIILLNFFCMVNNRHLIFLPPSIPFLFALKGIRLIQRISLLNGGIVVHSIFAEVILEDLVELAGGLGDHDTF